MESKKILEIVIDNCEFAKEFKYFLTIHQEGDSDKVYLIFSASRLI